MPVHRNCHSKTERSRRSIPSHMIPRPGGGERAASGHLLLTTTRHLAQGSGCVLRSYSTCYHAHRLALWGSSTSPQASQTPASLILTTSLFVIEERVLCRSAQTETTENATTRFHVPNLSKSATTDLCSTGMSGRDGPRNPHQMRWIDLHDTSSTCTLPLSDRPSASDGWVVSITMKALPQTPGATLVLHGYTVT